MLIYLKIVKMLNIMLDIPLCKIYSNWLVHEHYPNDWLEKSMMVSVK